MFLNFEKSGIFMDSKAQENTIKVKPQTFIEVRKNKQQLFLPMSAVDLAGVVLTDGAAVKVYDYEGNLIVMLTKTDGLWYYEYDVDSVGTVFNTDAAQLVEFFVKQNNLLLCDKDTIIVAMVKEYRDVGVCSSQPVIASADAPESGEMGLLAEMEQGFDDDFITAEIVDKRYKLSEVSYDEVIAQLLTLADEGLLESVQMLYNGKTVVNCTCLPNKPHIECAVERSRDFIKICKMSVGE